MDFNLINNIQVCLGYKGEAPMTLVRYSHIPTLIISMAIGFFVFIKNKNALVNRVLLAISSFFSLWLLCSLIVWEFGYNSVITMFSWSLLGIFSSLISVACLYFVYVFIDKKDISFNKKVILGVFLLPTILLAPTRFNLTAFDATYCNALEWKFYSPYYYILGIIVFIWILILAISRYKKAESNLKKQIIFLTLGIEAFILDFSAVGFIISYLVSKGVMADFNLELYALFGMPIFMGLLAYLIVKFKAFDIKLLGAQALVVTLVILTGSQFFFIDLANTIVVILVGVTVLLSVIFGIILINSVKNEVKRKEELQMMSNKLSQANDQLRKLDNAKSEFISIASHQLRTPLTAVKGFVSLLLEGSYGKVEAKQLDVLNKVYISNDRLIHLVEDLLNVSRMESGRMEFKLEPCDLKAICKEVMDTFYIRAKTAGLYLEYKPTADELPLVTIDGVKMREVISNIVDNAIKYCPKGGVTLKVEKIGEFERVTVSDTGVGIPPTELPYLFSKFSRGKDISRLNTGGTGLGLYVGRAIVEANGCKLWAESEGTGKGSRFIVEIPIRQDPEVIKKWS